MISKYSHKELIWIDLESPTNEEISLIVDQYSVPDFIRKEIVLKPQEDKISLDYGYIFVVINNSQISSDKNNKDQMIFIVNDDFVLTIHDRPLQALNKFSKEMELDIIDGENSKINSNKLLFTYLFKTIYINSQAQIILKDNQIKNLKKQIIKSKKKFKLSIWLFIIVLIAIIIICL